MLQYLHNQHQQKLPGTHRKLSKEAVEEALNMVAELTGQTPIAQTIIQQEAVHNNSFPLQLGHCWFNKRFCSTCILGPGI